jgi:hypothetical protein
MRAATLTFPNSRDTALSAAFPAGGYLSISEQPGCVHLSRIPLRPIARALDRQFHR